MITYVSGSMIRYSQFPDGFWKDIEKLMTDGDEILLGNSDFDHRVYGRCRNKQYKNVNVMRDVPKRKRSIPLSTVERMLPAASDMVRKCDRMIAVWDGESQEAFVNVLMLLALHKKCRMYFLPSGKCIEITSVDDLAPYVAERQGWTDKDMEEVLKVCGFEEQMISYMLKDSGLDEKLLTEIIGRAPISITKKRELMENLQKKNNLNHEVFCKVAGLIKDGADLSLVKQEILETYGRFGACLSDCLSEIHLAEEGLKYCTYYLFSEWYDTDVFIEKSYPVGMFDSVKKAMEYIKRNEKYEREDIPEDEILYEDWYRLECWYCDAFGTEYEQKYNYYIFKDEICWFQSLQAEKHEYGLVSYTPANNDFLGDLSDLDFPTPFKCGDIVRIDCRPFGPPLNALVVEGVKQHDCCFPTVLFRYPETDRWDITGLKHKGLYKDAELTVYYPPLSPLFRLRLSAPDELTEEDEVLVKISKELAGDEKKGAALWNEFYRGSSGGVSKEEVLKAWESVKLKGEENPE
ncbi:hypothetical protein [Butyrivibrio sp. AE2032]|uniref:hypothetical protein n=1 Tax=Butyrivibrio sp. AE2032 TaxID=1458463 RepID=UPI000556565B|nr:hypothetical protein [Butyrivibrio sp. AE2032]